MVKIDISDVLKIVDTAQKEFRLLPKRMLSAARLGAQYEKSNKTYQDRTGHLKASTKGLMSQDRADQVVVDLEMGENYASYVNKRGYSAITEAAKLTELAIDDIANDIGDKIASG